jgi:hypothetical protein
MAGEVLLGSKGAGSIAKGTKLLKTADNVTDRVETVQRAMSKAELRATQETGLLRGGREGTHYVSNSVNSDPLRARQRLSLGQTPEVRVTFEVPKGVFSKSSRVRPSNKMPGGGLERTASGPIPVRIINILKYKDR